MKSFPREFVDAVAPGFRRIISQPARTRLSMSKPGAFAQVPRVISGPSSHRMQQALNTHVYPHLTLESRPIPRTAMSEMTESFSDLLPKAMRFRTAFLQRKTAAAYRAAERIGFMEMIGSRSLFDFAQAVTGLQLKESPRPQIICYKPGDYVGPHTDNHPDIPEFKDGYVDIHFTLVNDAVGSQYLVYEQGGHLMRSVSVVSDGSASVYHLPFWHYTTPLIAKPGRESTARRWLLLATFMIERTSKRPRR